MANNSEEPIMMTMEAPTVTVRETIICGGFSEAMDADADIQQKADAVKGKILKEAGGNMQAKEFVVERYASQLVNGHNHKMKIRLGPGSYIHARLYEAFGSKPEDVEVTEVTTNKKKEDAL